MKVYYEIEDLVEFEAKVLEELNKEINDWKQRIQRTNAHARGVVGGLKLAKGIFVCRMDAFKVGR